MGTTKPNPGGPDPALVRHAALCGAMDATLDVFPIKAPKPYRQMLQRRSSDGHQESILEDLSWRTLQFAKEEGHRGKSLDELFELTVQHWLDVGPRQVSQLPEHLPESALAELREGVNVPQLLVREWGRVFTDVAHESWAVWKPALERRLELEHPLVRVARYFPARSMIWPETSRLDPSPVEVAGQGGDRVRSYLVHPNEAEDMLSDDELDAAYHWRLVPSDGVSAARIETALRLWVGPWKGQDDPPLRSLIHALTVAAGVLGEDVTRHPTTVTPTETEQALRSLLSQPPTTPPGTTRRRPRSPWAGFLAA